ncbi:Cytochrome P450 71B19 [Raphanus sativus]|nr:Cytochrome P450 71B19 [Raphanus sativus]
MAISLLCLFLITCITWLIFVGKKISRSKWNLPTKPSRVSDHRKLTPSWRVASQVTPTSSPKSRTKAAEEVLKTHDLDCCSRPKLVGTRLISRDFKDIGFTPYSEEWKERRKEEECNLLVKKLSESAVDQSPVDLSKTLFWLTASIVFRVAFGHSFHESQLIDKEKVDELIFEAETAQASFTCSDFFPIWGFGWLFDWLSGQHKRLHDVFFNLDSLFQRVIDDHMHPGRSKDQRDITDMMLDAMHKQDKDDSLKLTLDHIKGFLTNIFIAGIDTGALTMIWAMTELARNPNVMKKLQDHIRDHFGNNKERITEEDIGKVPYMNLVIKETFRLHPVVPLLLPRETMAHVKVQGYDIPPKRRILINAWAIARDPNIWKNPEEFIPERFIDSPVDYRGQHFELIPFGSGRRMCPGMAMGIATVELGLLNLLYFFDWKLPDGMTERDIDVEEGGTLTIVKKVPLKLVPVRVQ